MKIFEKSLILVVFVLSLSLLFSYGQAGAVEPVKFNVYLAGAMPGGGGVWDMIGAGLAEAVMRSNKGSVITVVPGNGVTDVPIVSKNEHELGLTHTSIAAAGIKGIDPFEEKFDNIKAITNLYVSKLQLVVNPKLDINNISEIKEEKIPIKLAVGDPGSTGELAIKRVLDAYGMSYDDIESWGGRIYYKDMGEASSMYGDNLIDAFTVLTLAPTSSVQEASSNKDLELISIDREIAQKMVDDYGYDIATIPQDAYDFMEEDIETISSTVVLITNDEQPEEMIYHITRGLVENIDYIRGIHSNLKDLTPKNMAIESGCPLHPGAEKYYKEQGVIE